MDSGEEEKEGNVADALGRSKWVLEKLSKCYRLFPSPFADNCRLDQRKKVLNLLPVNKSIPGSLFTLQSKMVMQVGFFGVVIRCFFVGIRSLTIHLDFVGMTSIFSLLYPHLSQFPTYM